MDRTNHLCRGDIVVRLQDLLDLLPGPGFARTVERRYDPGNGRVVLVNDLHEALVAFDLLLKPLDRLRLPPADHLSLGEAGFLGCGLFLRTHHPRVEGIQRLAECREPLTNLFSGQHHRPAPGRRYDRLAAPLDIGHQPLERAPDGFCIHLRSGGALLDARRPADLFGIRAAEHTPDGERPDDVAVGLCKHRLERLRRLRRAVRSLKSVDRTRDNLPGFEPVVPEGLDYRILFVAEDGVPLIEELEYEVVGRVTLPDIEAHRALEPELPDAEHLPALKVLSEQHRKTRRILWRNGKLRGEVNAPPRLDEEEVLRPILTVQPDAEGLCIELVDLADPEREAPGSLRYQRPDIDPAHSL